MQIKEAHEELKKMAGDKYCQTEYRINSFADRDEAECGCYIAGYKHGVGPDFATALSQIKMQVKPNAPEEEQTIDA